MLDIMQYLVLLEYIPNIYIYIATVLLECIAKIIMNVLLGYAINIYIYYTSITAGA